jgi:glucokinase
MKQQIVIGVDVGGSHITSAAIDLSTLQIIQNSTKTSKINNKGTKEEILRDWSFVINETIQCVPQVKEVKLGFAMPGPFHYKSGLAKFENNDKYENLFNVSIPEELPKFLNVKNVELRFLNDATSFGVGASQVGKAKTYNNVIAVTLGTGFGSCFITKGIPDVNSSTVPKDGCLWDKPFKDGIADDYFSTRWFEDTYKEKSGKKIKGVKEVVEANNEYSKAVFSEFSLNLAEFMSPVIEQYKPELIVLGGNVSNASEHFIPKLKEELKKKNLKVKFTVSTLMEEAAVIGCARLFDSFFWDKVKNDLPTI